MLYTERVGGTTDSRRQAAEDGDDSTLICGECGGIYSLRQYEHRNAERLLIQCPGCGAVLLQYTALLPVEMDDLPGFVAEHYGKE